MRVTRNCNNLPGAPMTNRRALLLAAAGTLAASGTYAALPGRGLPRTIWDPVLGEVPVCRGGIVAAQYREGTQREATTDVERDLDFMEKLGLLDGHLLIGRALLEANEQRLALPHFGHPVQELYSWLESRLAARNAPPFEPELQALERQAQANDKGPNFQAAWNAVYAKIAAARATVSPARANDPKFLIEHVAMMVEAVAGDYGESITRGRIVNILEYHDSAGFLRYALQVTQASAPKSPRAFAAVAAELGWIKGNAYPELLPPQRPPVSISSVRARADRVRAIAAQA